MATLATKPITADEFFAWLDGLEKGEKSYELEPTKTNKRISQYLRRDVGLVWLVDPEVRSVTVYRADRTHTVHDDTDELTGEEILPDLRIRIADLFTMPGQ